MTLLKHELRQSRTALFIWLSAIGGLLMVCMFLYPEMRGEMDQMGEIFSSMGAFTAAFGMDRLNFGTFFGFYAIECGNILGLGGALFAGMTAASVLSKEEQEGTGEFLLTHPVSRTRVAAEKLGSVLVQLLILNIAIYLLAIGSALVIGEEILWKELTLLHLSYFFLQIELAGLSFGLSSIMRRGSLGAGLGVAAGAYFLSLIANISEGAKWLRYVTPFAYASGADIMTESAIELPLVALGMTYGLAGIAFGFFWYSRKDMK